MKESEHMPLVFSREGGHSLVWSLGTCPSDVAGGGPRVERPGQRRTATYLRAWVGLWLLNPINARLTPHHPCPTCPKPVCAGWGSWWLKDVPHKGGSRAPAGME